MQFETILAAITSPSAIVVAAAAMQTIASVFSGQLMLRGFLLTGTLLYLLYYFVVADEPLWAAMLGSACIAATSTFGVLRVLADRSVWTIPKAHRPIYQHIGKIEPGAFRKLMKTATIKTFEQPLQLIEGGAIPERVYFTLEGDVDIEKNGHRFPIGPHNFIGEVSIIGGFEATATVHARAGSKCVVWDRTALLQQMQKDERFRIAVEALFARDMAIKLAHAVKIS